MEAAADNILNSLAPPPAAPLEITSSGYRFEHNPHRDGVSGSVALSHPGCPRLICDYGTRECFSLDQAIQLILYVYQKEYQFK